MDELLSDFVAETQESLEALANVVVALEADPSDHALLDELFRFFHTVKGSCGFLNLPRFEKLSHAAEDVLSDIRAGGSTPDAATITAVLAVMDRIAELCAAIETGESLSQANDDQLIETLHHCFRMAAAESASGGGEVSGDDSGNASSENVARPGATSRTIRLPLALIDQLMNGVSDMVLARNELARKLRVSEADPELETAFDRLSSCIADMRDTISKTRMQRVDRLFVAIPRMVRDLSRELGKTIDLVLEGGDVEMDREMVEMVVDPLTHIVRNSIDHGIELPEERIAAGKPEAGTLRVMARQSGSQIVIEVSDDGRGINTGAVVAKAVAAGVISAQDAAQLSDPAKNDLIFMAGLSTADKITAVSGRGVGMDVVRANIERIGGVISLESETGRGLTITMRVPLTLTIIPGLILSAGGLNFAIPRSAVIEILHDDNPTVRVSRLGGGLTATIRDMRYSMIDLEDVIGLPKIERPGARTLMVVRSASGKPYILGVNNVENHEELVIRPAAPVVMAAGIYAGMTLPDNGQPMLLLDAGGIAQAAQLPLISELLEGPDAEGDRATGHDMHPALRFVELTGEERVIRLSVVERVEDVPVKAFGVSGGRPHVVIGGRLVPCAHGVDPARLTDGSSEITCLRIRDDVREVCYPVRTVLDINEIPDELDMSVSYGIVGGLILIEGREIEVVDCHALLSGISVPAAIAPRGVRCVILDTEDVWNRDILAPLLRQAGYEVAWGTESETGTDTSDVILVTDGIDEASDPVALSETAILRLRRTSEPEGAADGSVYRYDREALLGAISSLADRRSAA